jgi:hypothetical protein
MGCLFEFYLVCTGLDTVLIFYKMKRFIPETSITNLFLEIQYRRVMSTEIWLQSNQIN